MLFIRQTEPGHRVDAGIHQSERWERQSLFEANINCQSELLKGIDSSHLRPPQQIDTTLSDACLSAPSFHVARPQSTPEYATPDSPAILGDKLGDGHYVSAAQHRVVLRCTQEKEVNVPELNQ